MNKYEKVLKLAAEVIRDARVGTPGEETPGYRAAVAAIAALEEKPGTRCECRDCGSRTNHYSEGRCQRDAVRMVTVHVSTMEARKATGQWNALGFDDQVPMCAACADWAEKGGGK